MRLLFSAVPAHGHVLPLAPLMSAALDLGHEVAVVVSAGAAELVRAELPAGVEHLPAGPMPVELAVEAAKRTGGEVMTPSVEGIGETFGGVLLDTTADEAVEAARAWRADVVLSEIYCTVGATVAATLGLPWHRVTMTAAIPADWQSAIEKAAAARHEARGIRPGAPASVLGLWPPLLRDTDDAAGEPGVPVLPVRSRAHRRPSATAPCAPASAGTGRPKVLVTLGTVFSDSAVLAAVVDAVAENPVDVVATLGLALQGEQVVGEDRRGAGGGEVTFVPFVPIDELLRGVDVVVGVGGAGTVLASLSHGVPLVLWPQGADQPAITDRVVAAGAGVRVSSVADVRSAVAEVLGSADVRKRAEEVASSMAEAADPRDAIRSVTEPGSVSP
ncbi:nucleotide disphospho-sugar-binding domain-containing protein [Prauserella cavernicola]|uniref:Glycosyltransferase n=1 Tax=Prauserella cavernicola TaxID=2800127 RepID=A0A934QSX4_9PSEU|nr:nucleotide disphospho-sugar-binding domain-containing protein [Prauserella cavernicola]MBK1784769.1 glycosyltransferase [Prauserella cavernicola]